MNKLARKPSLQKKKEASERPMEALGDFDLVKRARKGDDAAFAKLVVRYQRKVYSVALGMTKNPEDAMDITQDAFVKIHRYLNKFQGNASFYTWIYRIVINLCIDHIRREGRRANTDFDEKTRYSSEEMVGTEILAQRQDVSPSKMLSRKELATRIQDAVSELPEYHQAVIIMREIEGFSYTEMADTMNLSKGTVMSRLHHARQKLKKALESYIKGDFTVLD